MLSKLPKITLVELIVIILNYYHYYQAAVNLLINKLNIFVTFFKIKLLGCGK